MESEVRAAHGPGMGQIPHTASCMGAPMGLNMLGASELPLRQGFA